MIQHGRKFVACILIMMSVFLIVPQRTYAIPVVVAADPWTVIQTIGDYVATAYQYISSYASDQLVTKEFVYDSIAYAAIQAAREALVRSVIDWINNGFEGSPAFVQNLQGYLQNVGDEIAADFITGTGLDALCSPFALNIKGALALEYGRNMRERGERINSCSFTDITKNINNFGKSVENSFTTEDLFAYTSNPVNTPQGAYVDAKAKLGVSITNADGREVKLLDFGKGFLSKRECSEVDGKEVCKIITPGDTISSSLNKSLGLGADSLVTADEMNEIVGAFIAYLLSSTLEGGLTNAGSGGDSGDIGYTQGLNPIDQTQIRNSIDKIIPLQQNAVNGFSGVLSKLTQQCSSSNTEAGRIRDYEEEGVYATYIEVSARLTRATTQLRELQDMRASTQTATSTPAAISLTQQVSTITQSPDVYLNSMELSNLIDSYNNLIDARCRDFDDNQSGN